MAIFLLLADRRGEGFEGVRVFALAVGGFGMVREGV